MRTTVTKTWSSPRTSGMRNATSNGCAALRAWMRRTCSLGSSTISLQQSTTSTPCVARLLSSGRPLCGIVRCASSRTTLLGSLRRRHPRQRPGRPSRPIRKRNRMASRARSLSRRRSRRIGFSPARRLTSAQRWIQSRPRRLRRQWRKTMPWTPLPLRTSRQRRRPWRMPLHSRGQGPSVAVMPKRTLHGTTPISTGAVTTLAWTKLRTLSHWTHLPPTALVAGP